MAVAYNSLFRLSGVFEVIISLKQSKYIVITIFTRTLDSHNRRVVSHIMLICQAMTHTLMSEETPHDTQFYKVTHASDNLASATSFLSVI